MNSQTSDELRCHLATDLPDNDNRNVPYGNSRQSVSSLCSLDLGPARECYNSDESLSGSDDDNEGHDSEAQISTDDNHEWLDGTDVDEVSFAPVENMLMTGSGRRSKYSGVCFWNHLVGINTLRGRKELSMTCIAVTAAVFTIVFLAIGGEQTSDWISSSNNGLAENMAVLSAQDVQSTKPNNIQVQEEEEDEERSCIVNGDFSANPPNSNWYPVHAELKPVEGMSGNALAATNRENQQWGGMWQNIPSSCLQTNKWYEVRAYYHLVTTSDGAEEEEEFYCDPTIYWNNNPKSCPAIGLRVDKELTEIAWSVGPHPQPHSRRDGTNEWYEIYGAFRATKKMSRSLLSIFVARAPINADIIVDNISLTPATSSTIGIRDCTNTNTNKNLIINGNAETGDHRYWFIRGEGGTNSGRIEMTLGYNDVGYAFKHAGVRNERWRGMLQTLNSECLTLGSKWKITAVFQYYQTVVEQNTETGQEVEVMTPVECNKNDPYSEYSCPVFQVDFFTPGTKDLVTSDPLVNEDSSGIFEVGGWNRIEHVLVVREDMARHSDAWIYINSVESGYNYVIDEIEMVPLL